MRARDRNRGIPTVRAQRLVPVQAQHAPVTRPPPKTDHSRAHYTSRISPAGDHDTAGDGRPEASMRGDVSERKGAGRGALGARARYSRTRSRGTRAPWS